MNCYLWMSAVCPAGGVPDERGPESGVRVSSVHVVVGCHTVIHLLGH